MKTFLYAIASIALAGSTACQAAPSERTFAEDMLARVRAATPGGEMRIKADEPLVIQVKQAAGWEEAVINLHRVHGFCQNANAADCEALKLEFVTKISKSYKLESFTKSALRIVVRDEQYVSYIRQSFPDANKRPLMRDIGGGLFAILAFDSPDAISLANNEGLEKAGVESEAAWSLALSQTKAVLPEIPRDRLAQHQPTAFQDYEFLASLLADTGQWRLLAELAGPDMFVTAVSDSFVAVGFMPDGKELNNFKQTVEEDCRAQPRCVSPMVYRFRDGRWAIAQ